MRGRRCAAALLAALTLLTVLFIFSNSLKTGAASNAQSGGFIRLLGDLFCLPEELLSLPEFRSLVRSAAHFSEFALLGAELAGLLLLLRARRMAYVGGALVSALIAVADECIQIFVPNRTADAIDVLLDTTGALFGGALLLCLFFLLSLLRGRGKALAFRKK